MAHAKRRWAICLRARLLIALIMKRTHSPTLLGQLSHEFQPAKQLSASLFRNVAIIVICTPLSTGRFCNFQLHHNPLVSCRRVAEPHNSSIWSTDIQGNLSACTGLKVEDPINRRTKSVNLVSSLQSM